jgi:hypothetical protein
MHLPRFLSRLRREDGGVIGKLLLLLVVAALVYLGVMLVPPYIENYKFQKELESSARQSHIEKDDHLLTVSIQKEAETLGLHLPAEQIQIVRGQGGAGIAINTRYVRLVTFKPFGFQTELEFKNDAHARN